MILILSCSFLFILKCSAQLQGCRQKNFWEGAKGTPRPRNSTNKLNYVLSVAG